MKSENLDFFIAAKNNGTLHTVLVEGAPELKFYCGTVGLDDVDKAILAEYIHGDEDHIHQIGFGIENSEGIVIPKFVLALGCHGYGAVCNIFVDELANSIASTLGNNPPLFGQN